MTEASWKDKIANLCTRILTAAIAIPLLLIFIAMAPPFWFSLLIAIVVGVAFFEYNNMVLMEEPSSVKVAISLLGFLCFLATSCFRPDLSEASAILFSVLLFSYGLFMREPNSAHFFFLAKAIFGFVYIALLLGTMTHIRLLPNGTELIFVLLGLIWISDSAAFLVGSFVRGKWKLAPRVSPNKSWEGSAAGVGAALLFTLISKATFAPFLSAADAIFLGIFVTAFGQMGDLSESYVKRSFGTKDSGTLFPGHGGMLDRVDAFIFASPAMFLYMTVFH
jgi:phosphatidate cytidylyltransferase